MKKRKSSSISQIFLILIVLGFVSTIFDSNAPAKRGNDSLNKEQIDIERKFTQQRIKFAKRGEKIITVRKTDLCAGYGYSGSCMKSSISSMSNHYMTIPAKTTLTVLEIGVNNYSRGSGVYYKVIYKKKTGWISRSNTSPISANN